MASCSVLTKAYTVNGNIRDVSIKPTYTNSLLPKPSYGSYLRITEAAGSQKIVNSLKTKDGLVVSAKLGGLLGRKVEEEAKTAGTKSSTVSNRGITKLSTKGGTQKLAGTLKLLFGGVDDRPARELARDDSLVFVAGATGRVGSRAVRELVNLGFKVRAGARNVEKAEEVLADIIEEDRQGGIFARLPLFGGKRKQLEIVEADLESPDNLEEAIGAAGKVVCAIGAAENDALNITGPFRIDGKATKNLIRAAKELDVNQFLLVSSLGTTKFGFPASLLNLFWGVLIWKAQAEKELQDSGIAFTIVRPGGMERPKDDYKLTHNLRLAPANSLTGGQVSNLQIAELIGSILANPDIAENKVVEAVAETTAPLRTIEEMLEELPVVGLKQAERLEILRKKAEKAAEEEAEQEALEMQRQDEQRAALEQQRQEEKQAEIRAKLSKELAAAKEKQKTALLEAEEKSSEKAQLEKRKAELKAKAVAAAQTAQELRALQEAVLVAAKQGKILSTKEKDAVLAKARSTFLESAEAVPKKVTSGLSASKSQLFGGLTPWNRAAEVAKVAEQAVVEDIKQEVEITQEPEKPKSSPAPSVADARAAAEKKVREKLAKQAEAKAQKEAEETAEAERVKAEAAAVKAKLEAEEKEKAKAEEEIKAQAEAKAKAEAEEKAKVEAEEAIVKAEADEKFRKEEEKRRAEEEKEAKAAAKAADKQAIEDERKARSAAQKAKQEQDAKAAKERLAEQAIATALAADASSQKTSEATEAPVTASSSTDFPPSPTPLSPYTRYEDLKPPTSPTPSPPGPPAITDSAEPVAEAESPKAVSSSTDFPPSPTPLSPYTRYEDLKPPTSPTPKPPGPVPVAAVEAPVVEPKETPVETTKKPKTGGFRWPWQKAETTAESKPSSTDFPPSPTPLSPYTRYDDLKPPASPTPNPPVTVSAKTAEPEVKASSTDFPPSPTPLSPYTRYEDLKPPTSPIPKAPGSVSTEPTVEAVTSTEPEVKPSSTDFPPSPTPLSPYTRYPDLKPPSSPTPLPPFPVAKVEEVVKDVPLPSPSPPSPPAATVEKTKDQRPKWVAPLSTTKDEETEEGSPPPPPKVFRWPWEPKSEVSSTTPKPVENSSTDLPYANRPLSPYTQFPDLRPPSSPIPYSPDDL